VLERSIAELGMFPGGGSAVFHLARSFTPEIVGQEHYDVGPRACKRSCNAYKDLQDIIAILGLDELRSEDKPPCPRPQIQRFLSQPFTVAEVLHRPAGQQVPVADTVRAFKEILDGNTMPWASRTST